MQLGTCKKGRKLILYPHRAGLVDVWNEVAIRLGWFDLSLLNFRRDVEGGPVKSVLILDLKPERIMTIEIFGEQRTFEVDSMTEVEATQ